jgi:MFS family permease
VTTRQTTQAAIVWLLASSVFINYIDRTNLAIAGPLVRSELHITASEFGWLSMAFFVTYASCQLVSGVLADRLDVKWLLAGGFALWSLATGVAGVVHTYAALFVARLILGAGESVAYPSYSRILSHHFTEERRGWPNAVISAGFSFGLASGLFFGGMLVGRLGWRPFFVGLSLISLLWLMPWLYFMPPTPARAPGEADESPAFWEILVQREFIGTALGLFCANYFSYTLLTWLPTYLVEARHFTMDQMAMTGGVTYVVVALSSMAFGRLADARIRAGLATPRIRQTISASGLAISAVSLLIVAWTTDPTMTVTFLIGGGLGFGIFSSNHWAATQTMAGPLACGRWTGMENFTGNLAGVIAPVVVGVVVDRTGEYFAAFAVAAAITLVGSAAWTFVIRDIREVSWRGRVEDASGVCDPW